MSEITCINCRHNLQIDESDALWLTCPRCLAKIMNPQQVERPRLRLVDVSRPDREGRTHSIASVVCLVVFAGLILIGVVMFFTAGGHQLVYASDEGIAIVAIGIITVTTIAIGTAILVFSSKNRMTKSLTVALGTVGVALAGLLVTALLVTCAVTTAIIAFFQACGCK